MENKEARLFDLMETKTFSQLTENEKLFVLSMLTENEYTFQSQLYKSSVEIDYIVPTVNTLKPKKKVSPLKRSIPLYQVVSGIAAMLVGIYLSWPSRQQSAYSKNVEPKIVIQYQDRLIHDTVRIENKIVKFKTSNIIEKQVSKPEYSQNTERELVAVASTQISVREEDIKTNGVSAFVENLGN